MLDGLDDVPWSTLDHAYGDAGDVPNLIRALVSSEPDQREWAQDMLEMGPFHQGSLYNSTPFVVRFLLEIVREKDAAETPWILQFVSCVLAAAIFYLSDLEPPGQVPEQAFATQILVEIRTKWPLLLSLFEHPDVHVRLALLRLLVLLRADLPHLDNVLAEKLNVETDEPMRAALVFCLSLAVDDAPLPALQRILETSSETPLIRIAVGFGLIAAMKEQIVDEALAAFCEVIVDQFAALDRFEDIYAEYLTPLGAPLGKDRLLECLQQRWSLNQRSQISLALLSIYAQLPMAKSGGIRVGSGYYLEAMVRVAFPEGRLSPETTIRDLNVIQRHILELYQQYDMPSKAWNTYYSSDFRTLLGFDFRSETDFLGFMSGMRSARRTES